MQETITPTRPPQTAPPPPPVEPPPVDPFGDGGGPPERPKLKKLRLAFVLGGLGFIALISTVFGMMMAVASDIPALEDEARFKAAENSKLMADGDDPDHELARLTGNENRVLLREDEISPYIKNAVIAIEDKRFFEHRGVDYRGIARALWADVSSGSAKQGASTITQQFVKNALAAQGDRSVFQKLREAAAAYHLENKWSKQKILTQYLNSVYFGNGAYGIESAMRTYFGDENGHLDDNGEPVVDPVTGERWDFQEHPEAATATPEEAAFLAGIIASPSAYDPLQDLQASFARRNLVLDRMLEQDFITQAQHDDAVKQSPPRKECECVHPPQPDSEEPYFTTWVTQQAVEKFGPDRVFGGGMKIQTTLDPDLQVAAEVATGQIAGVGPQVSLVTIENATGEVKAMVGGESFKERPFNLATNGHRQPGSAFKPFILLAALQTGDYGPGSVFASYEKELPFTGPGGVKDVFHVSNYEDQYLGSVSLTTATAQSDNSIYAELGMKVGREKVAKLANDMGIRTKLSTNPAMLLGGLKVGVTPLEMAFAYSTLANSGKRVCAEWASYRCGPVAIKGVEGEDKPERKTKEVFSQTVADTAKTMLSYVITSGTGTAAQVGEFAAGKTGTTENYGDAWFCGFIDKYTTCVWVGYADKVQPMETEYGGSPVAGGTWPATIWQSFMSQAIAIRDTREAAKALEEGEGGEDVTPAPITPSTPVEPVPEEDDGGESAPAPEPEEPAAPEEPAPAPEPAPEPPPREPPPQQPAPPPQTPPTEGGGAEPDAATE
ncbi:MAG: penicillin-binding protein [Thermoleophilaceae bacterium]|jgi:penicillin-binding protein 1A|nr:penicillin-binding protein [Thermoleophilaceae bacterium]